MPKRKRKRTRLKPGPFLILGIIVVLVTGLIYSPLTSLSRATLVGVHPADRSQVEQILGALRGIPWIQVNNRWVETRAQRIPAVDHAQYSQNIFGRSRLTFVYRVPVARVKANAPTGMDARGVIFRTDEVSTDIPLVVPPPASRAIYLGISGGFAAGRVADLAVKAKAMAPSDKITIWFNGEGALCLNLGEGLVILGSTEELDRKLRALKEIQEQQPNILSRLEVLNLTEPSHPAKTYKKQRE